MLAYFAIEGVEGKRFFRCEAYAATLSTDGCAKYWREANGKHHPESRFKCRGCAFGAMHAGEAQPSTSGLAGAPVCARCHRSGSRLIGHHICVSCYNRQREWLAGRNAKGAAPIKQQPLRHMALTYYAGGEKRTLDMPACESISELIVSVLRDSRQAVQFGWIPPKRSFGGQLRLF